jgi:hypothetical protein
MIDEGANSAPIETSTGFLERAMYAFFALFAGNLLLCVLLFVLYGFNAATQATRDPAATRFGDLVFMLAMYAAFSVAGWALVGLPVIAAVPAHFIIKMPWLLWLLIGALLGPLALAIISFLMARGNPPRFAHSQIYFYLSIFISAVAFRVYQALLRRHAPSLIPLRRVRH